MSNVLKLTLKSGASSKVTCVDVSSVDAAAAGSVKHSSLNSFPSATAAPVTDLPLTGRERLEEPLPFREFCPPAALQACDVKEEIDSIIQC